MLSAVSPLESVGHRQMDVQLFFLCLIDIGLYAWEDLEPNSYRYYIYIYVFVLGRVWEEYVCTCLVLKICNDKSLSQARITIAYFQESAALLQWTHANLIITASCRF